MSANNQPNYLESVTRQFLSYKKLADQSIQQIDPQQLFIQPNENSNSMAVVIKHMAGNMISRWTDFLTTDGEKPWRKRDDEFENNVEDKEQLLKIWEQGWKVFLDTLGSLKTEDLQRTVSIRNEEHSVMDAINRQLAHYSYHVGQIVYMAKLLKQTEWNSLSIPKNKSSEYNAKKFSAGK
ncbi:MAG TPA: DinB family protein [Bacteroidia bacterium]|nr:DinB family protein [Bacteroidia bacterium]